MLNGAAVSWKSNQQPTITLSSAEAEYVSLCGDAKKALSLHQLLGEMDLPQPTTVIFEESQPCIHIAVNAVTSFRTKHVQLKCHFVRQVASRR